MDINGLIAAVSREIINPIIYLLFAVAALVFLWGCMRFIAFADDAKERTLGRDSIIWGLVGMSIMILALFIVEMVANSISPAIVLPSRF